MNNEEITKTEATDVTEGNESIKNEEASAAADVNDAAVDSMDEDETEQAAIRAALLAQMDEYDGEDRPETTDDPAERKISTAEVIGTGNSASLNTWKSVDPSKILGETEEKVKAMEEVKALTDQAALAEIARNSVYEDVRKAAVEKLTDQEILTDIALNDDAAAVRAAAVINISDPRLGKEILNRSSDDIVRGSALMTLESQQELSNYAQHDRSEVVRCAAILLLKNNNTIISIAKNKKESVLVRSIAVSVLNDPSVLNAIADDANENTDLRLTASKKMLTLSGTKCRCHKCGAGTSNNAYTYLIKALTGQVSSRSGNTVTTISTYSPRFVRASLCSECSEKIVKKLRSSGKIIKSVLLGLLVIGPLCGLLFGGIFGSCLACLGGDSDDPTAFILWFILCGIISYLIGAIWIISDGVKESNNDKEFLAGYDSSSAEVKHSKLLVKTLKEKGNDVILEIPMELADDKAVVAALVIAGFGQHLIK